MLYPNKNYRLYKNKMTIYGHFSIHFVLYIFTRYSMVLDIRRFNDGPQKYRIQTKMYRLNIIYIFLFIIAWF